MSFIELFNHNECWGKVVRDKARKWEKGWKFSDDAPSMYYVLSGRVRLMALDACGNEKTLWYLGRGCCFNETIIIAVRLRVKKKVQNLSAMWYKEFAKNFATQGDFGHESP